MSAMADLESSMVLTAESQLCIAHLVQHLNEQTQTCPDCAVLQEAAFTSAKQVVRDEYPQTTEDDVEALAGGYIDNLVGYADECGTYVFANA